MNIPGNLKICIKKDWLISLPAEELNLTITLGNGDININSEHIQELAALYDMNDTYIILDDDLLTEHKVEFDNLRNKITELSVSILKLQRLLSKGGYRI